MPRCSSCAEALRGALAQHRLRDPRAGRATERRADERARIDDLAGALRWYASSPGAERGFCVRCGSSLFFRSQRWPGELHITLAYLHVDADRAPMAHVFWDTHVDWAAVDPADGLPRKTSAETE